MVWISEGLPNKYNLYRSKSKYTHPQADGNLLNWPLKCILINLSIPISFSLSTLSWCLQGKVKTLALHHCTILVSCCLCSVIFWTPVSQQDDGWRLVSNSPWQLFFLDCVVDCRQFIDCGCLGYIVISLSSRVEAMRAAGSHALSRFTMHLEGARFKEKPQVCFLKIQSWFWLVGW